MEDGGDIQPLELEADRDAPGEEVVLAVTPIDDEQRERAPIYRHRWRTGEGDCHMVRLSQWEQNRISAVLEDLLSLVSWVRIPPVSPHALWMSIIPGNFSTRSVRFFTNCPLTHPF
jgi:hypothetical protein